MCIRGDALDAILDTGSSLSLIDPQVCDKLGLSINLFHYDIPWCVGIEGAMLASPNVVILGWTETYIGIPGMGYLKARFWVTDCKFDRDVDMVLGSYQIKRIFDEAVTDLYDCWPSPWKQLYYWYECSKWYDKNMVAEDDLYDSDAYEEEDIDHCVVPPGVHEVEQDNASVSSCDSWLDLLQPEEWSKMEEWAVQALIDASPSDALKGVPPKVCPVPPVQQPERPSQDSQDKGDELRMLNAQMASLEPGAGTGETEKTSCNSKQVKANNELDQVQLSVNLPSSPMVKCQVTPSGETILSFHWDQE